MKEFLAAVYLDFETSIARPSDLTQSDGIIGLPKDQELILDFHKRERQGGQVSGTSV